MVDIYDWLAYQHDLCVCMKMGFAEDFKFNPMSNKRLERTRHERASLLSNLGEPLKHNVMPLLISMKVPFLKKVTIIFSLLLSASSVAAQAERIGTFQSQKQTSGHVAKVVFRTRSFDSAKNKVGYDDKIGNTVNGRRAYGAEGIPKAEIASLKVFFDGEKVQVPRHLYSDCYDPNFGNEYVKLSFSRDFSKLFVSMRGSDGAGGYEVVWVIRRNGRASRFFKPAF